MTNFILNRRFFLKTFLISFFTKFIKAESLNKKIIIAFGSCSNQRRDMPHWKTIHSKSPDYLILLGDNVYGDFTNSSAFNLSNAYKNLKKNRYYLDLSYKKHIIPIWDDHDYGKNDGDKNWKFKNISKKLFLNFFSVKSNDIRWSRKGIYKSWIISKPNKIKIIALDTRTFKDEFKLNKKNNKKKYIEDNSLNKTILGKEQWSWLKKEIKDKYKLVIILSSFQVISKSHGWEKWNNFPAERKRLLNLLSSIKKKVLILSGDRHVGGFYETKVNKKIIHEVTSSSFNQNVFFPHEPDSLRVGKLINENNYGLLEVDFQYGSLKIEVNSTINNKINFLFKVFKI